MIPLRVPKTQIVCVLSSGGPYDADDVLGLVHSIRRYDTFSQIICLTDRPGDVVQRVTFNGFSVRALEHNWPSWWAKLEAFSVPGPALYLDIDNRVVGDIRPILQRVEELKHEEYLMLDGFYRSPEVCSGVMGWNGDTSWLPNRFADHAARARWVDRGANLGVSARIDNLRYRGDQDWIARQLALDLLTVRLAQSEFPGQIVSYKVHVQPTGIMPQDARIVCFHGRPRPRHIEPRPDWLTFPERSAA